MHEEMSNGWFLYSHSHSKEVQIISYGTCGVDTAQHQIPLPSQQLHRDPLRKYNMRVYITRNRYKKSAGHYYYYYYDDEIIPCCLFLCEAIRLL
jgi:hypothetical protein